MYTVIAYCFKCATLILVVAIDHDKEVQQI